MARPTTAARRYAEAAFEIALRDKNVEAWRRELDAVGAAMADERLAAALANPATPLEARERLAGAVLDTAKASKGLRNLMLLLLRRGRIELLPRVAREFQLLDDRRQGVVEAFATSAAPLGPEELRALTAKLEQLTGGRVALDHRVDPTLVGGLVVRVGDRLIDGSVRGRLERLRNRLVSGAL